jgi:hypothetical protein
MANGFKLQPARNWLMGIPMEDSYAFGDASIAVARGIPKGFSNSYSEDSSILSALKFLFTYERPSPSRNIAEMFTLQFPSLARGITDESGIIKIFDKINSEAIRGFNLPYFQNADSPDNKIPGCFACGAVLNDSQLIYGQIGNSGLAVIGKEGKVRFATTTEEPNKYHVLNGSKQSLEYVRTGTVDLASGDLVLTYTNPFGSAMFNGGNILKPKFSGIISRGDYQGLETLCRQESNSGGALAYQRAG